MCGKPLDEVLNTARLSQATGVTETDVRTLLDGGEPPTEDPDAMVRRRVRFLYETHTGDDGQPKDVRDIAAAIGQTTVWVRRLVAGDAKPNLVVGHALCKYYGVAPGFLTDSPADALNRELQPVVFDLEVQADPEKTLADLGVRSISGRSPMMEKQNWVALAQMVASMAEELRSVNTKLDRLQNSEGGR
ncbi:hypothetical protein [Streptomyces griseomycini]|uniref:XRE family transcriptional regulator n=1 Tax=Streptomyces griseomycini TaxID=66895 RepID=A0A7W7PWL2_9ACTN|nr:hypothetical protein [Streptomyces griseomycini]MBB4902613.1 hypothetical protein [Streptomyces griseomycini]